MGVGGNESGSFERAKVVFVRALGLPPDELAALLERDCGGDAALRAEVEELLRHASASAGFLEVLTGPQGSAPPAWLEIPGFRLIEVIDAGSSGHVFRAEQERPRREVAIKVLRLDHHFAPGMLERFQREAEILARLDHPGIAQVLGAGIADSAAGQLPWIAMELVRGRDLAAFLREERPDVRAVVALFRALCEAVGHAHERGVVHRDLKPSNVLVDAAGRLRVIDFGIARTLEDARSSSERTRTGLVMGTIAYMAPEQARGDGAEVGVQADVYALGVMLFEALTGSLPLEVDAVDVLEGVRIVREVDPIRLRALRPDLAPDLETILLVTLEKEPLRRYAGAAALGDDLARWLANRPVLARRPTLAYQARKFVRRNRALTCAAATVIVSLAGGLVLALRGLADARAQRNARSELVDMFTSKFFDFAPRLGFGDELRPELEEILAILELQLVVDPESRRVRAELARAQQELGNLDQARNDHAAADERFVRALALCEALVAEDPEDLTAQTRLAQLRAKRGETARDRGDLAGRDRWFARGLELDERLVREHPDDLELREDLGWSLARIAQAAIERGDFAEAQRLQLRRLSDAEDLVRREPASWKYVYNLSTCHCAMVELRVRTGDQAQVPEHVKECLRLARELVELRAGKREALVWLLQALRVARADAERRGAPAEALACAEEALALAFEVTSRDPYREEHLGLLLGTGWDAGRAYLAEGRFEDVRRMTRRMRRIAKVEGAGPATAEVRESLVSAAEELEARASSAALADRTPPPDHSDPRDADER